MLPKVRLFYEDFDNVGGPTAGGAGTYSFPPAGYCNVDNFLPIRLLVISTKPGKEERIFHLMGDSVAFSTSWYTPAGIANDWMWTPLIGPITSNSLLSWNAVAYDPAF